MKDIKMKNKCENVLIIENRLVLKGIDLPFSDLYLLPCKIVYTSLFQSSVHFFMGNLQIGFSTGKGRSSFYT